MARRNSQPFKSFRAGNASIPDEECRRFRRRDSPVRRHHLPCTSLQVTSPPPAALIFALTSVQQEHNRGMHSRLLANSICDTLLRHGHQALLVGGCVRDLLLKQEPADYDVTTDAAPEQVMQIFPESIGIGAQFGVILVRDGESKVEVATFRSDVGYSDGRHPDQVVYARTAEEDVSRRDFTINGLLMRHDTGEVLDFVAGQADLQAGLIRSIGDPERRFTEDKLRMLRGVRFAARLAYRIEPVTLDRKS